MAQYQTDLRDIYFNLFECLKVQDVWQEFEQSDLRDIVDQYDKFVGSEVFPTRILSDSQGVHLEADGAKAPACFKPLKQKFYENGWFGLGKPEEIGGMPAPHSLQIVTSSLSCGANVSFEMYIGLTRAALNVILKVGTDEQRARYVEKIMTGDWGGTMCLTEPGAGSDVGAVGTTATPSGNGKYNIKGVKIFISSGESDLYENNIHLVLARTPGAPEGTKGLSLFIVPRFKIEPDGSLGKANDVYCTKVEEKMGIHGSATCELTFGQKGNCEGELIGKEFEGMANMFIMMNEARLMCGLQGESQGNLAYMLTLQYAKERMQFGSEIYRMPDVKRMLLKMRCLGRGMRSLILYTAHLFDLVEKGQTELESEIAFLTPICKAWCSEEGFNVSIEAIQVHGGYGYCTEYGIEQFARDTKIATIYEGTNGIQAMDFTLRKNLKENGATFQSVAGKIMRALATPEAQVWPQASALMGDCLQKGKSMMEKLGGYAAAKDMNRVLEHSMAFMQFSGNLIIGWRLLDAAIVASSKISSASTDDKKYYQSKIDDFIFYSQHKLTQNIGLAHSVLNDQFSLNEVEL